VTDIAIQLPDELKTYLQRESARCGYKDVSEYVQELIEADKRRKVSAEIEEMLLEAADGPFTEWTDKDVEDIRRAGDRIIQRRKAR
jgi:Arc/MetJ-type ribon-helix-helix transcriptional regulator